MKCPITQGCSLFPLFRFSTSLRIWQVDYCVGVYEACARFQIASAGAPVPPTLLPNGKEPDLLTLFPRVPS